MEDNHSLVLDRKKNSRPPDWQDFLPLAYQSKTKVANPVTLVEKVLISRLKAGDYPAFSSIFTAYYQDLVIFAMRFTHDLNNAEEIVQDTFVKLWEEHESIKVTVSLRSYLLKVVQNKCIDWYRHKKIMQTHNNVIMENSPQLIYDTDSYILHSELQEQIEAVLCKLPEEISEAFRMNRNKGLKYHEIADLLGVSVRTIEVRIGKALHMLRNHLEEYFIVLAGIILMFYG
jgi:RNA polymerase sigma-70 factor (ECF subfamily)